MIPTRRSASLSALGWLLALAAGCQPLDRGAAGEPGRAEGPAAAAIRAVLAADSELGAARNHAPETGPLADAVRAYVAGMDGLDLSGCPEEFAAAFARHRDAWEASLELFGRHGELRGEMHQLFEDIRGRGGEIRAELERAEKRIWDTWAEVEAAAGKYGALPLG